jgi:hypothetical protein
MYNVWDDSNYKTEVMQLCVLDFRIAFVFYFLLLILLYIHVSWFRYFCRKGSVNYYYYYYYYTYQHWLQQIGIHV